MMTTGKQCKFADATPQTCKLSLISHAWACTKRFRQILGEVAVEVGEGELGTIREVAGVLCWTIRIAPEKFLCGTIRMQVQVL